MIKIKQNPFHLEYRVFKKFAIFKKINDEINNRTITIWFDNYYVLKQYFKLEPSQYMIRIRGEKYTTQTGWDFVNIFIKEIDIIKVNNLFKGEELDIKLALGIIKEMSLKKTFLISAHHNIGGLDIGHYFFKQL